MPLGIHTVQSSTLKKQYREVKFETDNIATGVSEWLEGKIYFFVILSLTKLIFPPFFYHDFGMVHD